MIQEKLIVALDVENPQTAFQLIDTLGDHVSAYKLGPVLFTRSGTETIRFLHERRKRIFVDLKLHDTPQVVAATVAQLAEMGVEFATLHSMGGRNMLEAAAKSCRGSRMKLLAVTLLTSFDPKEGAGMGWQGTPDEMIARLSQLVLDARLAGILCAPSEAAAARNHLWKGAIVATPGIRPAGIEVYQDDQIRTATPQEALDQGADWLIVGRPITMASDPLSVVQRYFSVS